VLFSRKITSDSSQNRIAWQKFKSDPIGFGSFVFILFIAFVSLFTYFIVPDKTSNCDRQQLEIALIPSFTTVSYLKIPKDTLLHTNIVTQFLYGKKENYQWIPIKNISVKNDSLFYEKIIHYTSQQSIQESRAITQIPNFNPKENLVRKHYFFGTDRFGRDFFSRLVLGARISLLIGFTAVIISLFVGIFIGSLAGYYGGKIDAFLSWCMNVIWSIPTLLMVLAITIALGKGLIPVFIAVGLSMWVDVARIVRGQFLSLREKEFIEAGKALGYKDARIILHHILPNAIAPILVIATSNFAAAILVEAGLSFLGFGVQPPAPTWGNMIETNRAFIITSQAHLAIIPGIAIATLVLAFTLVSNALRNAFVEKN